MAAITSASDALCVGSDTIIDELGKENKPCAYRFHG